VKLVLDARFAIDWIAGASSPVLDEFTDRFAAGTLEMHAPEVFVAQTADEIWHRVRDGRLTLDESVELFGNLRDAGIELHRLRDLAAPALDLAMRRGIPAHASFYAALALREGLPLFTADAALAAAAADLVEVVTP
jgi:predicted nucleic acid-binding protein